MRVSLEMALFSQDAQKKILCMVADDLDQLGAVEPLDWLGNPLHAPQPPRRRPIQWSLPDIISADRKPENDPRARIVSFEGVSAELRRVATEGTGLHCIFAILLCIFLCDNFMDMIVAGTPQNICERYFLGFEQRMTVALCGKMGYDNETKSGEVLNAAKPPCQIAIEEIVLVQQIYHAHGLKAACSKPFKKN